MNYSELFDQICDPTHIYEYDFELDPNNIMPNNVRIIYKITLCYKIFIFIKYYL